MPRTVPPPLLPRSRPVTARSGLEALCAPLAPLGSPLPDHGLAAALARAGLVVAQPLHVGDNWRDATKAGPEPWRSRPTEVLRDVMHPWPAAAAADVARPQLRGAHSNPAFDSRMHDEPYARVVQFHRQNLGTP